MQLARSNVAARSACVSRATSRRSLVVRASTEPQTPPAEAPSTSEAAPAPVVTGTPAVAAVAAAPAAAPVSQAISITGELTCRMRLNRVQLLSSCARCQPHRRPQIVRQQQLALCAAFS